MTTGPEDKTSTHAMSKTNSEWADLEGKSQEKVYLEGEMRAVWDIMEDLPEGKFAKDLANVSNAVKFSEPFHPPADNSIF